MDEKYNGILNDLIVIEDNRYLITKYMPYADPKNGRSEMAFSNLIKTLFIWIS